MSRRQDLQVKRNRSICIRYRKLSSILEFGVAKYSFDWIMKKMEDEYFLDQQTIWCVIRDEPAGGYEANESKE